MVSARTSYFQKADNSTGTIDTEGVAGAPNRSCRPVSLNPAYIAVSTDQGELNIWDKAGVFQGTYNFGVNLGKICINNVGEVLAKIGTNIYLVSKVGALLWGPVAVANLVDIGLGETYVCCGINTHVAGSSGVQWRSRVDGGLVHAVYGTANLPENEYPPAAYPDGAGLRIGNNQTGLKVFCGYGFTGGAVGIVEMHDIIAGRVWASSTLNNDPAIMRVMSCYDAAFALVASITTKVYIFDINGAKMGQQIIPGFGYPVGKINPNGTRAVAYTPYDGNATIYRLIPSPFSVTSFGAESTPSDVDISEDDYIVYSQSTNIRVRDGPTLFLKATIPVVLTGSPISVVRNTI